MDQTQLHNGQEGKPVDFIFGELNKKRKLEEQSNLPSPKYKFKSKPSISERAIPLHDAFTSEDNDSKKMDTVKQPETNGAWSQVDLGNGSTVLAANIENLDTNADIQISQNIGKISENIEDGIARDSGDENIQLSGFVNNAESSKSLFHLSLVPRDERQVAYSSGNSCVSELSKHICYEASCSYDHFYNHPVNHSGNALSNQSCCSPGSSTICGVGPELSKHSIYRLGRKSTKKRMTADLDHLHLNLKDFEHKEDKQKTHHSYVENNQLNRLLSGEGTQAEQNVVNLSPIDGTETDSVESIVSAYKPAMVKRSRSVITGPCSWEFSSGCTADRHTSHLRTETQMVALGEDSLTSNEISEELDPNDEFYSEIQTLSNDNMAGTSETLPIYVLSSGRASRKEEARRDSRPSTIDQDFEQYFSMLML